MNRTSPQVDQDRLMLSGDLNFSTANRLWEESLSFLKSKKSLVIDFSNVRTSNSAGLALIVECLKWAKQNHKQISFQNIPQNISSITKICNLDKLIFP